MQLVINVIEQNLWYNKIYIALCGLTIQQLIDYQDIIHLNYSI